MIHVMVSMEENRSMFHHALSYRTPTTRTPFIYKLTSFNYLHPEIRAHIYISNSIDFTFGYFLKALESFK